MAATNPQVMYNVAAQAQPVQYEYYAPQPIAPANAPPLPPYPAQYAPPPPPPVVQYEQTLGGVKRPAEEAGPKRPRPDSAGETGGPFPQRPGEKMCAYYMTTRTCSFGVTCRFDHPAWVPQGGIPNWKEVTTTTTPVDPATLPHRPGEPDCAYFMKTGECRYGVKCRFNHPKERPEPNTTDDQIQQPAAAPPKPATGFTSKGLPVRPTETNCGFYSKTGSCKYGASCRYNHPEPAWPAGNPQPQSTYAPAPVQYQMIHQVRQVQVVEMKTQAVNGTWVKVGQPMQATQEYAYPTATAAYSTAAPTYPSAAPVYQSATPAYPNQTATYPTQQTMQNGTEYVYPAGTTVQAAPEYAYATVQPVQVTTEYAYATGQPLQATTEYYATGQPVQEYVYPIQAPGQPVTEYVYATEQPVPQQTATEYVYPTEQSAQQNATEYAYPTVQPVQAPQEYAYVTAQAYQNVAAPSPGSYPPITSVPMTHPQRPGEPDCTFFIKTGECSFGATCRFHHPPDRIPSGIPKPGAAPAVKLSLAGLPRRENELPCAFYMKTGTCKYGITCKFDHPPPSEVIAKAVEAARCEVPPNFDLNLSVASTEPQDATPLPPGIDAPPGTAAAS